MSDPKPTPNASSDRRCAAVARVGAPIAACGLGMFLLASALLQGCGTDRSLNSVRASGERAAERGLYQDAVRDFSEWVERDPANPEARLLYARALRGAGESTKAREQLWVAHSLALSNNEIFDELASTLRATGDHAELLELLRQRTIDRGQFEDYKRLADTLLQLGDPDAAERTLITAARVDRGRSLEPQLALADFYAAIGDRESELTRLRMASYLDPQSAAIERRIRSLGEIPGPTFSLVPSEAAGMP